MDAPNVLCIDDRYSLYAPLPREHGDDHLGVRHDEIEDRERGGRTIPIAMIAVAGFSLARGDSGTREHSVSSSRRTVGYFATFLLAVYGGFFSGGYVTMLTAVFVLLFGRTFLQSVATTKVVNAFPQP